LCESSGTQRGPELLAPPPRSEIGRSWFAGSRWPEIPGLGGPRMDGRVAPLSAGSGPAGPEATPGPVAREPVPYRSAHGGGQPPGGSETARPPPQRAHGPPVDRRSLPTAGQPCPPHAGQVPAQGGDEDAG